MITGIIIGVILLAGLAFTIYKLETAPTFEQAFPNFHPQCSDCNKDGSSCPTCPFRDKNYRPVDLGPEHEYDDEGNLNWMGTDDVPPAPEGMRVYSNGKLSMAYINAKDEDIKAALDIVMQAIDANSPEHHISVLRQVHACLMRALL